MYCTKCGFKNEEDAMFCANCGSVMSKTSFRAESNGIQSADSIEESIQTDNAETDPENNTEMQNEEPESVQPVEEIKTEPMNQQVDLTKPESVQPQEAINNMSDAHIPVDLYQSPTVRSVNNANTYQKNQFSAPRFIFSLIILLATICSIVTIALNYVGMKMELTIFGYGDSVSEHITGFDIIKEDVDMDDMDELEDMGYENSGKLEDSLAMFRYFVIAFAVAMLIFCVIDFILLCLVRRKIAYILTMIFAVIKAALGGVVLYLWAGRVLGQFEKLMQITMQEFESYGDFSVKLEFVPSIGLILALAMQAVIFISAIVLLCVKPKYKEVESQTIHA